MILRFKWLTFPVFILFSYFHLSAKEIKIEAENAILTGSSVVINSTLCSEGRKVGGMGAPPNIGGVKFNVSIEKVGTYQLILYYLAGDSRNFDITVNEGRSINLDCPTTGGWDTPGLISTEISLVQGNNTILINNLTSYAPDLDAIILNPMHQDPEPGETRSFFNSQWKIDTDLNTTKTDIFFNNKLLINGSQGSFKLDSIQFFMEELENIEISESNLNDEIGTGKQIQIMGNIPGKNIKAIQRYYLYNDKNFLLTDLVLNADKELSSNYIAAVYCSDTSEILPTGNNKSLWVPFDNDKWVRYHNLDFGVPVSSHEVGALYNTVNRSGLIVGSTEHDLWKTGINSTTSLTNKLTRLSVISGVTSNETRDVLPHGTVKGKTIKSPKIFIGFFEDWRKGMEGYADINEIFAPKLPWDSGKPFLWNSWGAIQTKLSYTNVSEVSEYIANNLQNNNFENNNTVYIDLDSYWDNITYSNLKRLVNEIEQRGQKAGIYWTPFVDWGKNPDRRVEGSTDVYYRDIYLYANGQPQEIAGAWAIDPTHPASIARMDLYLNRFIDQGFTFLKLDFLCHGSLEGDSFYDPQIFTGIQAYNAGMKYIIEKLEGKMFINLSISPLFPSQYGHSRRIACDAYADINSSEYTLNSLTYGWWLDHVYSYNDADNVVLNGVSLGENRVRVTSSVITGIFCIGDDFSSSGYNSAKLRAQEFLTKPEINRVARQTKAFFPVEVANGSQATEIFMQSNEDTVYIALFNYTSKSESKMIDFKRIGLHPGTDYIVQNLWSEEKQNRNASWEISVPRRDVKFLKIYPGTLSSAKDLNIFDDTYFYPNPCKNILNLKTQTDPLSLIYVYNFKGQIVKVFNASENVLHIEDLMDGIYLFTGFDKDGNAFTTKIMKNS